MNNSGTIVTAKDGCYETDETHAILGGLMRDKSKVR